MSIRELKLVCLFAVLFFVVLFSGTAEAGDLPLTEIPVFNGQVQRGELLMDAVTSKPYVSHIRYQWISPVIPEPGVVTVQCKVTGDVDTVFGASSVMIPPRSIDGAFGMLTLHLNHGVAKSVECHWQHETALVSAQEDTF